MSSNAYGFGPAWWNNQLIYISETIKKIRKNENNKVRIISTRDKAGNIFAEDWFSENSTCSKRKISWTVGNAQIHVQQIVNKKMIK